MTDIRKKKRNAKNFYTIMRVMMMVGGTTGLQVPGSPSGKKSSSIQRSLRGAPERMFNANKVRYLNRREITKLNN